MLHFNELSIRSYTLPDKFDYKGPFVRNWFSNFEDIGSTIEYHGYTTTILEKAYVACKNPTVIIDDKSFVEHVFSIRDPGKVKFAGRPKSRGGLVDIRDDFEYTKLAAMDCFLRQRWRPELTCTGRLLGTSRPIVEWNNWHDNLWGIDIRRCTGRNALGRLLDRICIEIETTGDLKYGADESDWIKHQEILICGLNSSKL